MGTLEVQANLSATQRSQFLKALLRDVRAFELMLERGDFESARTIGAEQEMVLVDREWQPAMVAMEVLGDLTDRRITTEVARFNLEANLTPRALSGDCLSRLEAELHETVGIVREACRRHGADIVLTGILPTLAKSHLGRSSISDRVRYFALDEALRNLRGGPYRIQVDGLDEVTVEHDNVLLEALNTSFQLHYQVDADEFAPAYNLAQLLAGPMIALAANSPVLFGKRLWRETRIAIFQQTVDTRRGVHERDLPARVRFGESWIKASPLELFKSDIARFRVILGRDEIQDPFPELEAGRTPRLEALQLHNSTVYRWNRACYGVSPRGAHLRIENRVLPAGPTILDEVANAAFWFGLMRGGSDAFGMVCDRLSFDEAHSNFVTAARHGMNAEFSWFGGRYIAAQTLLLEELLPVARAGLAAAKLDAADIDRFLGVVEQRVATRRTGAQWMLTSGTLMRGHGTRSERLAALTAATHARQFPEDGTPARPVHEWEPAQIDEGGGWTRNYQRVGQYMATELFTVHEDDTVDLVVSLMDWEHVRHVPVEDDQHRLVGIVSYRPLLAHLARCMSDANSADAYSVPVQSIMRRDPVSVTPETRTVDAIALMREHRISCLPVTTDGRLVGIITEHDFMTIAGQLLEAHLRRPGSAEAESDGA